VDSISTIRTQIISEVETVTMMLDLDEYDLLLPARFLLMRQPRTDGFDDQNQNQTNENDLDDDMDFKNEKVGYMLLIFFFACL
jgi:hypothetical protein